MASTRPVTNEIFMCRLNCPAMAVLITRKSRFETSNASGLTLSESPVRPLIQPQSAARPCPVSSSSRLVGKPALLGPKSTTSIRKCRAKNAATAITTTAAAPRTKWGRSAAKWDQKSISALSVPALGFDISVRWGIRAVLRTIYPPVCLRGHPPDSASCFRTNSPYSWRP